MLDIFLTKQFRKDYRKISRTRDISPLLDIIDMLRNGKKLPERNRDHALTGEYRGMRECHIAPDWLLIYRIDAGSLILVLSRTGSHSELFH